MNSLKELRETVGATQSQFADRMGVPFRTYQDIETGKSQLRPVHMVAARFAAIEYVMDRGNASKLPRDLRDFVRSAALLLEEDTRQNGDDEPKKKPAL